jgi:hypothetical protein
MSFTSIKTVIEAINPHAIVSQCSTNRAGFKVSIDIPWVITKIEWHGGLRHTVIQLRPEHTGKYWYSRKEAVYGWGETYEDAAVAAARELAHNTFGPPTVLAAFKALVESLERKAA